MRLALREEMREIDQQASGRFGISEEQLMENAGRRMAEKIQKWRGLSANYRIAVLCGPGKNGGDGLVTARHLLQMGFLGVQIWKLKSRRYSPLFELNETKLKNMGIKINLFDPNII